MELQRNGEHDVIACNHFSLKHMLEKPIDFQHEKNKAFTEGFAVNIQQLNLLNEPQTP
jgi:hypothetical protein